MSEANRNVVIWGDGGGSTANATLEALHNGEVDFTVTGIITANEDAGILDVAARANADFGMDIATLVVEGEPGRRQDEQTQESILRFLADRETRTLSLMGAMVIMGAKLVNELNGSVPEESYPKTLEEAREIMVESEYAFGRFLPTDFPKIADNPGKYGLINTHPAPTVITANTHGLGASRRVVELRSLEGGQTLHIVSRGIDTGPTLAFNRFSTTPLPEGALDSEITAAAKALFTETQRVEKEHIPYDLEQHLIQREEYHNGAA